MRRLFNYLNNRIYDKIIKPIAISVSPINEVAMGASIGMFIGLTPTVGIQMWIVFIIWLVCKYLLKIRFDLIIGTAIVWISNPFTMFFIYYGFLVTGLFIFSLFGIEGIEPSFASFQLRFDTIINHPQNSFHDSVRESMHFLIIDLGKPMLLGSLFYAIPFSIISYFMTQKLLLLYRKSKAARLGMDYESWRRKFERSRHEDTILQPPNDTDFE